MCGFAGIVDFKKILTNEQVHLESMTDTLKMRGPDQHGYKSYPHVLFGHRRLIVVDPKGGLQPMTKEQGGFQYTLIYNGELYNTEDIRKELLNNGYQFDSYSDTEVLLTAYMCWGVNCVEKLNGIFAFAVYDEKLEQVLLVRDQLGVKPFFYSIQGTTLIFGSEIKTVLAHPAVSPTVDREGLTEIFGLGPAVRPGSAVFKEISELSPAHLAIINKKDIVIKEYWQLRATENHETLSEATEHLQHLLIDAIERQLVGDVPLCTFLSGGLDSSAISAIAARSYQKRNKVLTTYSLDYEDNDKYFKASIYQPTSDQYWALQMAEFIQSNHRTYTIKHDELAYALKSAVLARDLPGMADIDSSLFLFCKEIREDFIVALSGECADEVFGGYPWYTRPELRNLETFPWSNFVRSRKQLLSPEYASLPLEEIVQENYLDSLKLVPQLGYESLERQRTREIFYLNMKWFMVNLLNRKDRMSMANSLEVRVPFADYRLVEYAFNLPDDYLFYQGREKGLLRKALKGILPEDIIYRKKSPYPKTHNPIYTQLVSNMLSEVLQNKNAPLFTIINKEFAQKLVDTKGEAYTRPWFGQLMTGPQLIAYLVQLNIWLESYKVKLV
ncbi:asparagine synthase (glutamine-hydrolyzing) [Cellulosilyticum lentocellum]|uniref:asparagine synthase (glutamine-hydrolyzing) n=1 Tax=Cellulosilyticum lentocellum (strain ATCC 49066 / DSM 5427 / NCIMB 11756 / RHM5) TaxID=642492 RepID=F2JHP4_CELLD|nr:asparagine synthase (glutamine-hydrolyzing) [Cellulosilyticum lentocellum]ADZ85386.1 asparagine synthase (glutamine-hydrolyzing) [Cellulosilyticum lentocellum DSM 5427]